MTPALLIPAALAAFIALVLPLLIHLARRSEQRPTDFAALRWLRQKPRPRSRIRFDERLLLALRLLLIAAIALWLARPVLFGSASKDAWTVMVPGVDLAQARAIAGPDAKLRWLQPGFPDVDTPAVTGPLPVASLLRQLDAERPAGARLTIFVPPILEGADAERPRLSRPVEWRILSGARVQSRDVAQRVSTSVHPERLPSQAVEGLDTNGRGVVVRYAAGEAGLRYIRAASIAWRTNVNPHPSSRRKPESMVTGETDVETPFRQEAPASVSMGPGFRRDDGILKTAFSIAPISEPLPAGIEQLIWLAPGPLPGPIATWIEQGGTALLGADTTYVWPVPPTAYWRDDLGAPLVEGASLGKGRVLRFTRPLLPSAMPQLLDPDFPDHLRALFAAPVSAPSRVDARAYTPLTGGASYPQPARELQPWLAVLIASLLIAERWLATRRTRGIAP